jgi:hypothetical protein
MLLKIGIPLFKVLIDCRLCDIHRLIVTIVDDRPRHATEDRLDHIQELSTRRQRRGLDERATLTGPRRIVSVDTTEKLFRNVP